MDKDQTAAFALTADKQLGSNVRSGVLHTDAFGEPRDIKVIVVHTPQVKMRQVFLEVDGQRIRAGELRQRGVGHWRLTYAAGYGGPHHGAMAPLIERLANDALYHFAKSL